METNILAIIKIRKLKQHEDVDDVHLEELKADIYEDGMLKSPIIVDLKTYTVLDGHHRLNCLKQLGVSKVPCILVDYFKDKKIRVSSRRKEYEITKENVVKTAKAGQKFPFKTTKHYVPYRIKNLNIPLTELI
jgi:L-serine kinase (ADP)